MGSVPGVKTWLTMASICFLFQVPLKHVEASDHVLCPTKIAYIPHDAIKEKLANLEHVYHKLGCNTDFIPLPGRRGINAFNTGQVDGEFFRLPVAEAHYKTAFIKSQNPVWISYSTLFGRPGLEAQNAGPIGYNMGVMWQEKYVENKDKLSFSTYPSMLKSYDEGVIDRFVMASKVMENLKKTYEFKSSDPIEYDRIGKQIAYHYLKPEFSAFMKAFDAYLDAHPDFWEKPLPKNGL